MFSKHLHLTGDLALWEKLVLHAPFLIITVLSLYKLWLLVHYLCYVWFPKRPGRLPPVYPMVTIQLPMYNEKAVFRRCIESAVKVRWPADKLEILLADDSDQEDIILEMDALVAQLQARGVLIKIVRRSDRQGYKAGALSFAMQYTRGEFCAIFDADFVIQPDFLERALPYFYDASARKNTVGVVQCPWAWLNEHENILTRAQAIWLDAHFIIEQNVRSRSGKVFGFNGTAGIWRTQAILDGGHWSWDSVTEDCDLGYRAHIAGYTFAFLPTSPQPCELPSTLVVFKGQQHRWIKGFPQVMLKLLTPIVISGSVSWRGKVESFFHLTGGAAYVFIVVQLLLYPAMLLFASFFYQYLWLYFIPLAITGVYYLVAGFERERIYRRRKFIICLWGMVMSVVPVIAFMFLQLGISCHTSLAWFEGWYSDDATFVKTSKEGFAGKTKGNKTETTKPKAKLHISTIVEMLLFVYFLTASYFIWWEFGLGIWREAVILPITALAYGCFAFSSLQAYLRRRFARPNRMSTSNNHVKDGKELAPNEIPFGYRTSWNDYDDEWKEENKLAMLRVLQVAEETDDEYVNQGSQKLKPEASEGVHASVEVASSVETADIHSGVPDDQEPVSICNSNLDDIEAAQRTEAEHQ
jgi:cellulose synthase/poly-beta-1,6-N-acetylglucosamine synthase-like glycosyltransferase